jgi:hypothetical protein
MQKVNAEKLYHLKDFEANILRIFTDKTNTFRKSNQWDGDDFNYAFNLVEQYLDLRKGVLRILLCAAFWIVFKGSTKKFWLEILFDVNQPTVDRYEKLILKKWKGD